MRRALLLFAMGFCGPVELRSDSKHAVFQYNPRYATLADAAALAKASRGRYGKQAVFKDLTDDGPYDAFFNCLPQMAQAPPAFP